MPTVTQRIASMNAIREGDVPGFVPGTETTTPGRTEKRRLARARKHQGMLALRRMLFMADGRPVRVKEAVNG